MGVTAYVCAWLCLLLAVGRFELKTVLSTLIIGVPFS